MRCETLSQVCSLRDARSSTSGEQTGESPTLRDHNGGVSGSMRQSTSIADRYCYSRSEIGDQTRETNELMVC